MLSFGHEMTAAHTNSQQLWLPTHDLDKVEPVKTPACVEEGQLRPQSSLRSYWQLGESFFQRVRSLVSYYASMCVPYPCTHGQHWLDSVTMKEERKQGIKERKEERKGWSWTMNLGRRWAGVEELQFVNGWGNVHVWNFQRINLKILF